MANDSTQGCLRVELIIHFDDPNEGGKYTLTPNIECPSKYICE